MIFCKKFTIFLHKQFESSIPTKHTKYTEKILESFRVVSGLNHEVKNGKKQFTTATPSRGSSVGKFS
jgi:hypothetical protein